MPQFNSLAAFQSFIKEFIGTLVSAYNSEVSKYKSIAEEWKERALAAEKQVVDLADQLNQGVDAEVAKRLAQSAAETLGELSGFADTVVAEFNPTLGTDILIKTVQDSSQVSTPPTLEEVPTLETVEPTSPELADEALNAIVSA